MANLKKKSTVQDYCPFCHTIHKGVHKGVVLEPSNPEGEFFKDRPLRYHGHPLNYKLCPECEQKDLPRAQFRDIMAEKKAMEDETDRLRSINFLEKLKRMGAMKYDNTTSN